VAWADDKDGNEYYPLYYLAKGSFVDTDGDQVADFQDSFLTDADESQDTE